jgi:glycosyltransferase involved in cell wall biosynthesis
MSDDPRTQIAVSVIVPVYNVEAFLAPCLDSLVNAAFDRPMEIVLVDDGSTDSSGAVCQRYVRRYPELFRLLPPAGHQGISVARNTGVRAASGEYFTFVDGDDLVPPNAFHDLYHAAVAQDADVVKGNNTMFNECRSWNASYNTRIDRIYHGQDILAVLYEHRIIRGHTWGRLFRRVRFAAVQCTPGVTMAQDVLYCAEIFQQAQTLAIINKTVYHYRLRRDSTVGRKFESRAYLWWLYSVEESGRFAQIPRQIIRHKQFEIRTLLQLAREARALPIDLLPPVLDAMTGREQSWDIRGVGSLLRQRVSVRSLLHYLAYRRTLQRLRKKLRRCDAGDHSASSPGRAGAEDPAEPCGAHASPREGSSGRTAACP